MIDVSVDSASRFVAAGWTVIDENSNDPVPAQADPVEGPAPAVSPARSTKRAKARTKG